MNIIDYYNIVAIDTPFGKRILIMKVKTKAIIKITIPLISPIYFC